MVQTGSLLKCPHPVCNFCALSVPEIQAHLGQCPLRAGTSDTSAPGGGGEQLVHVSVDVKPAALLKREPLPSVKQEAVDPLKQEVSPPADDGDGDAASDGVLAVSATSEKQENNQQHEKTKCKRQLKDRDDEESTYWSTYAIKSWIQEWSNQHPMTTLTIDDYDGRNNYQEL